VLIFEALGVPMPRFGPRAGHHEPNSNKKAIQAHMKKFLTPTFAPICERSVGPTSRSTPAMI